MTRHTRRHSRCRSRRVMFRRSPLALVLLAVLALTAAACGGGGSSASSTSDTSGASQAGSGDAQAVLSSIKTNVGDQGPQKIAVEFTATISGAAKDPTLGAFLTKPISIKVEGPADTKAKKSDLTFELSAGPIKVDGGLRQVGDASFLAGQRQVVQPSGRRALDHLRHLDDQLVERRPAGDPQGLRRPDEAVHEREARRQRGRGRRQVRPRRRATSIWQRSSRASRQSRRPPAAAPPRARSRRGRSPRA